MILNQDAPDSQPSHAPAGFSHLLILETQLKQGFPSRPEDTELSFSYRKLFKKTTDGCTADDWHESSNKNYIKITFLGISAWV